MVRTSIWLLIPAPAGIYLNGEHHWRFNNTRVLNIQFNDVAIILKTHTRVRILNYWRPYECQWMASQVATFRFRVGCLTTSHLIYFVCLNVHIQRHMQHGQYVNQLNLLYWTKIRTENGWRRLMIRKKFGLKMTIAKLISARDAIRPDELPTKHLYVNFPCNIFL